jgi:crotonobetainyl-CoA:carnitine CoA-transferase CaiB-like acyl-CoA transferase
MKAGDIHNKDALAQWGRPLDGIRVLALEQMQTLPVATQLMVRLGAEVVKVEAPGTGESGRQAQPAIKDRSGASAGATFLRYGLGKKSVAIDLKSSRGRQLVHDLVPHFDVVCENLGPGRGRRLGVDYDTLAAINPRLVYLSVSGFGNLEPSPYAEWPAYAGVAEAMCGAYEYSRRPGQSPIVNPMGGVGDTAAGMCGLIGVLAALRQRDRIGRGQYVDISMVDAMVHMCDYIPIFWSMGLRREPDRPERRPTVMEGFRASDGWFMMQVSRRHHFERLAKLIGKPEWLSDERFSTPWGWQDHLDDVLRPGIEAWSTQRTKMEASRALAESGVVAAPCYSGDEMVQDPHIKMRRMLIEVDRTDGVAQPVMVAGNPVKMSLLAEGVETDFPVVGEHTREILEKDLGMDAGALAELRAAGVIG